MSQNMINKCKICNTINPLGSKKCIKCNESIVPIHNNEELIKSFIEITGAEREISLQFLEISNSLNDAISIYLESNNNFEVEIQDETTTNNLISDLTNELSDRFNMPEGVIDEIINIMTSGNSSERNGLFDMLENNSNNIFQYPKTEKDFKIQILFGWGKNKPHYCKYCLSKAFFNLIKVCNTDTTNLINMVPERIFNNEKISNDIGERIEYLKKNLEGIDTVLNDICNRLSDTFDNIYKIHERLCKNGGNSYELFLDELQDRVGDNFRIIWETLHQSNNVVFIEKKDRSFKLIELTKSSTFIQFVTNDWEIKIYNHPVDKETVDCLKHIEIKTDCDLKKLNIYDETCPICLDKFSDEKHDVTVLDCHTFHKKCVLKWFETNDTCPICRKKIQNDCKKTDCNKTDCNLKV